MKPANSDALDAALGLDPAAVAQRDQMLGALAKVRSADELWELYRSGAVPPGAPQVQLVETRRAIFWAASAMASLMGGDHARLLNIIQGVQAHAETELRAQLAQMGALS